MNLRLKFLGASRNVTGSCFCVELDDTRILVDCGMYQEREFRSRNWDPLPVPLDSVDAILLTHAHLDHCGLLPKLVKDGFAGCVYCTPATADIAEIVVLDSGSLQERDAAYKRKRHKRQKRKGPYPVLPLYTMADAQACLEYFTPVPYGEEVEVAPGLTAVFNDAGHILGSSMIKLKAATDEGERTILFSGDVGRWDAPIIEDPSLFKQADYVVVESTYGNRHHDPEDQISDKLAEAVSRTASHGGKILIPSFAIERAQELLYRLNLLLQEGRIPHIPVYLDSPMAVKVTEVFMRHPELFDDEAVELMKQGTHPCDFPELRLCRKTEESKALNTKNGPFIIIAGSGMCTGGRIKHHLKNGISNPNNTVLFVGYQAQGTLGRVILEGAEEVRIHGREHQVRANVTRINGFSAHADRDELMRWLSALESPPRRVFVVHGEEEAAEAFGRHVHETKGWRTFVPQYKDEVKLD